MRDHRLPAWLKELKRREAAGDAAIREKVILAIMNSSGWPRGTVQLILQGYNLRSEAIDTAAERCLGMEEAGAEEQGLSGAAERKDR